jgi:alkylhydroperoxidase family enzyme
MSEWLKEHAWKAKRTKYIRLQQRTLVATTHASDDVYERVRRQFNEADLMALTFAIVAINAWNRVSISFRAEAGTYRLQSHGQLKAHRG